MRQKHDERYKKVFSSPIFIELLLKSFVHENFIKGLDFSKLIRLDKSFVDKKMQNRESDLIWKINFKDRPIYFYVLLEFQSTVDKTMPLRFLRYILELTETYGIDKETGLYPAMEMLHGQQNLILGIYTVKLYQTNLFLILSITLF